VNLRAVVVRFLEQVFYDFLAEANGFPTRPDFTLNPF